MRRPEPLITVPVWGVEKGKLISAVSSLSYSKSRRGVRVYMAETGREHTFLYIDYVKVVELWAYDRRVVPRERTGDDLR